MAQDSPSGGIYEQRAEVRDSVATPPGFQAERIFAVPREELGSWVSIALDHRGRILASDQGDKGICRITPGKPGSDEPTKVERLDLKISAAQGMLYAFDSLYISVNGGIGSGLYRARDTNGDDQYDELVKLTEFRGGGEHGPHALRLAPDGKSIYVICGNHTDPPAKIDASRLPTNWGEDLLLPRQWDARGHARGRLAPGGWIAKTDPDGATWEIVSNGYRNAYDMDFNADGELFAYDADMEWDFGMPWYRPTRAVHAVSGSEFGWRSGTGKWPTYYVDSLPPMVDIGPGSPVGVAFGYGAKFPAKYQKALYLCDWTFGTMYAIHLTPNGATYDGELTEFVSGTPLPLTDVLIGTDGAMYFTIGGRGTESELYRVTYVGDESTAGADAHDQAGAELRKLRRVLEQLHNAPGPDEVTKRLERIWPQLGHEDRFIRYAARVALEHLPVDQWSQRALSETNPHGRITAMVALARQGEGADPSAMLHAMLGLSFGKLNETQQLEWLRACQLICIRRGAPDEATAAEFNRTMNAFYPSTSHGVNRELSQLLVFLQDDQVVAKTMALMDTDTRKASDAWVTLIKRNQGYGKPIEEMLANQPDAERIHLAFVLRNATKGWTNDLRKKYFAFLNDARKWSGGASYTGFLNNIDDEAYNNATDIERLAVEAAGVRQPYVAPQLPTPEGPGHAWTMDEVMSLLNQGLKGRNFKNGERTFAAARCVICHRFGGQGGATGPDLTQAAGRFKPRDVAEAIVEPNKVVSDQYLALVFHTHEGLTITGRIVSETKDTITVLTNPEVATEITELKKSSIESMMPSPNSLMPSELLNTLNQNEVLDLFAYLLSRGNPDDPAFKN
jgi:putative heme-binding domain-containing protein